MKLLGLAEEILFYQSWVNDALEVLKDREVHLESGRFDGIAQTLIDEWELFHGEEV